jgi:TolB-like protein
MKSMLLAATVCMAAWSARADDLRAAAEGVGQKLGAALQAAPERRSISAVASQSFAEQGAAAAGLGAQAAAIVGEKLGAATKVAVLDRLKLAATPGQTPAQVSLIGSVQENGETLLLQARLVLISTGKVLASAQQPFTAAKGKALRAAGAIESQSIEVAMRRLADGLAVGFEKLPGSSRYRRLAVLPFSDVGDQAEKRKIGTIVTAEVATNLRRDHGLFLVERARLAEVMSEVKLGQSGAVDSASAPEIGKLADAQALVIGTASDLGDRYLIDARIVGAENGETLAAESASVPAAGMVALASDAVVLRSRKDAAFRSLLIPGWGQIYNREPVKGGVILASEVGLFGAAIAFHFLGEKAYSDYTSKTSAGSLGGDPTQTAQSLYDTAHSRYQTRNVLLFVAGGLWLANIFDAYFSGVDGDSLLAGGVAQRASFGTDGRSFAARLRF